MGLKIYRPDEEVCFQCGKYVPKNKIRRCKHAILGKVSLCMDCFIEYLILISRNKHKLLSSSLIVRL